MAAVHQGSKLDPRVMSGAVVVHCSEAHYQDQFHEFLSRGLRLDTYALLALPGGAHCLTLADTFPRFSWSGWRWLEFLLEQTKAQRVVLIAHDDCRWYLDSRFGLEARRVRERQAADLQRVRGSLKDRLSVKTVELYYARLENGRAAFEVIS